MENNIDLLDHFETLPEAVKKILLEIEHSYQGLNEANQKLKKIGYMFDYGLDAEPYGLREIGKLWKLMESNGGYSVIHSKGLSEDEADIMRDEYAEMFPDSDWWTQVHDEDDDKEEEERHYNENACDGWEDIYNYEE